MKKRIAILTIVVALAIVFAVVLTSCDAKDDGGDAINIAGDYDASLIEQKLNALKTDGIFVKIKISGETNGERSDDKYYAYGAKGDVYFFQYGDTEDQLYIDLSHADRFETYECEKSESGALEWTKKITHYSEYMTRDTMLQTTKTTASAVWSWLGYYSTAAGEGTKTSVTFLDRSCDKYVISQSAATIGAAASVKFEYVIDKETGVCLKFSVSGSATSADGRETGSYGMVATEFNTRWTPTLPTFVRTYIDGEISGGNTESGGNTGAGGESSEPQE